MPETGNIGTGGGAYLLLDACPGCSGDPPSGDVPVMAIAGLADLGHYQHCLCTSIRPRCLSSSSTIPPTPPAAHGHHQRPSTRTRGERHAVEDHPVGELVSILLCYPPNTGVRPAVAPGYPHGTTIGAVACSPDDVDHDGREPELSGERVVWIGECTRIGYLPEVARTALGHGWS